MTVICASYSCYYREPEELKEIVEYILYQAVFSATRSSAVTHSSKKICRVIY